MLGKYIADRKFYRELFIIVTPIIIQFFIQNMINFLDNLMVGKLSYADEAIASISVANQYYKLFYASIVSLCTGASIFTAQFFGSKQYKKLQNIFSIKLVLSIFITIIFMIFGFVFSKQIIAFFIKDSKAALDLGVDYLRIALWSYLPLSISAAFTFTFRPLRMAKIPMIASSIGMIVNLIMNFFLIYGIWIFPELGVKGAAIATVIARVMELLMYLIVYFKHDFVFKAKLKEYLKINLTLTRQTIKKVIPLFLNEMAFTLALIIIFKVYSEVGVKAISAITIADIVSQIVFILASGLGTATSILVGYKLGANELEEAEKNANYLLGYAVMVGFAIFIVIGGLAFVVPQYYNISETTRKFATYAILIQGAVAPIIMFTRIPFFILRSGGRVIEIILLDGLFMWVVKVPVTLLFGYVFKTHLIVIYLAVEATRIINAVLSMYFYKQKKWLNSLVK